MLCSYFEGQAGCMVLVTHLLRFNGEGKKWLYWAQTNSKVVNLSDFLFVSVLFFSGLFLCVCFFL